MKSSRILTPILGVTIFGIVSAVLIGFLAETDVIVTAAGELRPIRWCEIRPPVEGIVVEVYRREGDDVKAGDAILRIDGSADIIAREKVRREIGRLEQEQKDFERRKQERKTRLDLARAMRDEGVADVAMQEAKVTQVLAELQQAEVAPDAIEISTAGERVKQQEMAEADARKSLEDAQMLFERNNIPRVGLDKALTVYQTAQSETRVRRNALELLKKTRIGVELEKAKSNVASQRAGLLGAKARVQEREHQMQLAELALQDVTDERRILADLEKAKLEEDRITHQVEEKTLRAHVSGTIYDFHVKSGQTVTHKDTTGWVYDTSAFLFYARVKQLDLSDVAEQQAALVYFDALPYRLEGTFDAKVHDVSRVAAPPTAAGGANIGALPGVAADNNPQALVRLILAGEDPRNERLRVGFTGFAEIIVGRSSLIGLLFGTRPRNAPNPAKPVQAAGSALPSGDENKRATK